MGADAAADRSEWIGIARELVSFFEASFRDQSHVPAGVRVCGTGHHAGKVGIQPISIHLLVFESLQHERSRLVFQNRHHFEPGKNGGTAN
jgi:hypothetical protein